MYLCGQCHIQWGTPYYDKKVWSDCGKIEQDDYLGTCEKLVDCPNCADYAIDYIIDTIAYPDHPAETGE